MVVVQDDLPAEDYAAARPGRDQRQAPPAPKGVFVRGYVVVTPLEVEGRLAREVDAGHRPLGWAKRTVERYGRDRAVILAGLDTEPMVLKPRAVAAETGSDWFGHEGWLSDGVAGV